MQPSEFLKHHNAYDRFVSEFEKDLDLPKDSKLDKIIDDAIEEVINEDYQDKSLNNGGKTDYYQLSNAPFLINDFDDFAEWRKLNGNQFNIGKVVWTFNVGRHNGTDYIRDLNKIKHYVDRELLRLKREELDK